MAAPDSVSDDGDSQPSVINFLDIVATQGDFLVTCPNTPIHPRPDADEYSFTEALHLELRALSLVQQGRAIKYGTQTAAEWPIGRTPPEVVEKRKAELRELQAFMEAITPVSCSDDDDDGHAGARSTAKQKDGPAAEAQSSQPPRLLTPSPSNFETLCSGDGTSETGAEKEEEEEAERPTKIRVIAADANPDAIAVLDPPCGPSLVAAAHDNAVHETPRNKRQRDPEEEGQEAEQRPSKVLIAAAEDESPRRRIARPKRAAG
ncbi:hypothetical protein B0T19DRAFT_411654 [Cercophora scortea]|uniref:Uncharacterized protein n=1 Tax=Cercophora scortea TaxID=314031 RepID=A0AAE0J5Z5_9PEZI|nr:hypothetical protein B0T19DRAFT_411654 [Cercophora scortea]